MTTTLTAQRHDSDNINDNDVYPQLTKAQQQQ